jgi:hypothetical protein
MRQFAIFANNSVNSYKFFNYAADISDCAGILKQSIEARNRVEIVKQPGGIGFLESIIGLPKSLDIRALFVTLSICHPQMYRSDFLRLRPIDRLISRRQAL